jgi:hypothetical protein
MASIKQIQIGEIALTTGSTVNIDSGDVSAAPFSVADNAILYRVTGTQTLSVGNFVITITGSSGPTKNTQVRILWEAVCSPASNDVIIAGTTIPDEMVGSNFEAICTYSGAAWKVVVIPSMDGTGLIAAKLLATDSVTTAKILALNVTTAKINDLAVTTGKIADVNVTTAKIADLNVTTGKIADLGVTTGKIADLGVTTAKINDLGVTTGKIADLGVTAAKIANATVTPTKMSANANTYTRDIAISFMTAAEVGVLNFIVCEDCTIDKVSGTVMSPFAADDGTVVFKNNAGTVMTDSQIDFTTALVLGNQVTNTVTANNAFTAGQKITLELSKTTKTSGKAIISLCITKV